jgi:hypothetical protein
LEDSSQDALAEWQVSNRGIIKIQNDEQERINEVESK